mmetsp:Transcript_75131/g.244250  ORF Transcript_75131/g.244250 Transcript_75131/m.244250 type:complete len:133 (-) Transcript_75131:141-539(-)
MRERRLAQLSNTVTGSAESLRREIDSVREAQNAAGQHLGAPHRERVEVIEHAMADLANIYGEQVGMLEGQKEGVSQLRCEMVLLNRCVASTRATCGIASDVSALSNRMDGMPSSGDTATREERIREAWCFRA